jgi:hypothetical protein
LRPSRVFESGLDCDFVEVTIKFDSKD